jgi:hypothetical protein
VAGCSARLRLRPPEPPRRLRSQVLRSVIETVWLYRALFLVFCHNRFSATCYLHLGECRVPSHAQLLTCSVHLMRVGQGG